MNGLGGTGAQVSKDCSFGAGTVSGAPLRVSWFLVIFFVYQLIDAVNNPQLPLWFRVLTVTGNEFLLLLTVLSHEMGHGTMARRCGGEISEVLLWPFGGICFTTRAQGRNSREKLIDDLWIVGAGPATHFPMAAAWVLLMALFAGACSTVVMVPAWYHLMPFTHAMGPCFDPGMEQCLHTWSGMLMYNFLVQAIQMNVMLFMFNVFFPMYPMDGAKLIVCSLQLFCGASARCAAKVLVYTSAPLAVLFIGHSFMGMHGGGLQPGITAYMGFMCLMESYKIYNLMKEERLHTHPLFELARSNTRELSDSLGSAHRMNTAERDDPEAQRRAPQVQFTELKPFSGSGQALGGAGSTAAASSGAEENDLGTPLSGNGGRKKFLERMENQAAERSKTVRELEDEKYQRMERERLTTGKS